ncbi:MAG: 6-phosphogluconolactonase [Jatrophihabitans sp.]|uniref:6-phosphogluconolactonase n=1 Tax=Jatrophihabitans sp. TaxID=1932789 RepID=UPI003F812D6B
MNAPHDVVVLASADALAEEVAHRVVGKLAEVQQTRERVAIALTAGSIMESVWRQWSRLDDGSVDWSRVDVFWGDERFVPADSHDRNVTASEQLLFGHHPFDAATRYPMPAVGEAYGDDLDAAAAGYAQTLRDARRPDDEGEIPNFDVVLLGIGPDGHCCSLFPDHPSSRDLSAPVIPVRDSPKPPPLRLSLSFDGLNNANEIWVIASGDGKRSAAAAALAPDVDRTHVPSGGAHGRQRTLWFLDEAAAADLPARG